MRIILGTFFLGRMADTSLLDPGCRGFTVGQDLDPFDDSSSIISGCVKRVLMKCSSMNFF